MLLDPPNNVVLNHAFEKSCRKAIEFLPQKGEMVGRTVVGNAQTGGLGVLEIQHIRESFVAKPDLVVITRDLGFLIDQQDAGIRG
jgi:hypothetical protein